MAASPSILLLDEPAAGLDENESRELGDVVVHLARQWGMGIAIVEHDFSLVQAICDRLVVLDHGTILAEGATADRDQAQGRASRRSSARPTKPSSPPEDRGQGESLP